MEYRIRLFQSADGWSVSCPVLSGCHSQGKTREEAVANIRDAIREWIQVEAAESGFIQVEEEAITV